MSGWGAYGANPKSNPFAEDPDAKFGNPNSNGAWDIPLRDNDEPAPAALPAPTGTAGAASSGGVSSWFGGGKKKAAAGSAVPMSKEEELAVREAELKRREAELNSLAIKTKNWPWFWPWVYHDIGAEVPAWNRKMVRFAYLGWLLGFAGFMLNLLIALILMITKYDNQITVKNWFIILVATLIGLPLSFFLWYRSLYFAAQTDGSIFRYTKTFLYIMLQLAWSGVVIVSPPINDWANQCGILTMIELFNKSGKGKVYGILCLINVCLWGASAFIVFTVLGLAVRAMRAGPAPRIEHEARNRGSLRV